MKFFLGFISEAERRNIKKRVLFFLLLFLSLSFIGCADSEKGSSEPLEPLSFIDKGSWTLATDMLGRELAIVPKGAPLPDELKDFPPSRIIRTPIEKTVVASGSYDPAVIFGLGCGETIIGVSEQKQDWFHQGVIEGFKEGRIIYIGEWNALDYETIKILAPELVLISSSRSLEKLEELGFPTVGTYSGSRNNLENRINLFLFMGALYDRKEVAQDVVAKFKKAFEDIASRAKGRFKPKTVWGLFYSEKVFTLPNNFWLTEIMVTAGVDYVFKDLDDVSAGIDFEAFVIRAKDASLFFANAPNQSELETKADYLRLWPELTSFKAFTLEGTAMVPLNLIFQDAANLDQIAIDTAAVIDPNLYPARSLKYFKILYD
jgi:ABC-type Fe3+-hydroxamate transport system substrate-binding protein